MADSQKNSQVWLWVMSYGFLQKKETSKERGLTYYCTSSVPWKENRNHDLPCTEISKLLCLTLLPICDDQSLAKIPPYLEFGRVYLLYGTPVQVQSVCCTSSLCFRTKALIPSPFFSLCFLNQHFHSCDFNRETKIQK